MNRKTFTRISAILMYVMVAITVFYCGFAGEYEDTSVDLRDELETSPEWLIEDVGATSLPYVADVSKGEPIVIKGHIPEDIGVDYAMTFKSVYCANEVYIEGEKVAEYGRKQPLKFGNMVGNIRVIVPVEVRDGGKEFSIRFTPYYYQRLEIPEIEFGYMSGIKTNILNDNMFRLVLCVMMGTIFIVAIGISIYEMLKKSRLNVSVLNYFNLFVGTVICWILCSSDLPQFFFDCNEAVSLLSYLSIAAMGAPYMGFCEHILTTGKKHFLVARTIGWFIPILNMVLFVLGICDPPQILTLSHLYLFSVLVLSGYFATNEWNKNKSSRILVVGMLWFVCVAIIGIAAHYKSPSQAMDATILGFGLLIFIFILFALILFRQLHFIEERKYMETLKSLAFKDILTQLGNRAAFDENFRKIKESAQQGTKVTLFMFDLNFLKTTNDNLGHQEGDKLLMGLSQCMQVAFKGIGECYRLGGDEFAVIALDFEGEERNAIEHFEDVVSEYNKSHERRISCAIGYATTTFKRGETFFRELFKEADHAMYIDKERKHEYMTMYMS